MGMLDMNTSDGRFLFFLPWQGAVVVGTTDVKGTPVSSPRPPEQVRKRRPNGYYSARLHNLCECICVSGWLAAPLQEIQWILNEVKKYLSPELRVRRSDVLSAWYGWRPLASDPNALPGAPISRDHIISTHPQTGTTFITGAFPSSSLRQTKMLLLQLYRSNELRTADAGGKWTTYREMAEDVRPSLSLWTHTLWDRRSTPLIPYAVVVQVVDRIVELKQFTHATEVDTSQRPTSCIMT
jgi:glycerol-3-phosphate dehydrogenase